MKTITNYMTEYLRFGYKEDEIKSQKQKTDYLKYDDQNRLILEEVYDKNGVCISRKEFQYNAQNLLIQMVHHDENNELIEKMDCIYDEAQHLVVQNMIYGEDETIYSSRFTYQNQKMVQKELYEDDAFVCKEKEVVYENDLMVKESDFDEDGVLLYLQDYKYNENRQLIEKVYTEAQLHDKRTFKYEYDTKGNVIKVNIYNYTGKLISEIKYAYNDQKLLTEQVEEDGDGYRRQCYYYDDNQQEAKIENIDKSGKINSYTENTYNTDKELTFQRNYVIDEVKPDTYRMVSEKSIEISDTL